MHRLFQFRKLGWALLLSLFLSILCVSLFIGSPAKAQKTLKIATEPAFPPFEFQGSNGELVGFDIDLLKEIGKAAGFQVQFQSMQFDGIIPALQAKTVDAAVSGITITAERQQAVDFSRPYFKAGLAIAVKSDNQDITSLESLQNKRVAVQIGTTGALEAKKIPGAKIRTFDNAPLSLQELLNGNVDAVINDAPVTLYAIKENNLKGLKVTSQLLTEEYYGIPTAKGSPNLDDINRGLTAILNNGTYEQIYRKWFNAQPPQLPESTSIEQSTNSVNVIAIILSALPTLLKGVVVTLYLTILCGILGMIGGSLIGIARLSPATPLRWATIAYIDFLRGTPLLVQILMIYFGIPTLLQGFGIQFSLSPFVAAVTALSLNSAAYIAEIVRGGIQSIEKGQTEAAQSLGLGAVETMRYVIFPQALRRMLPPLANEFITLLKDTSLASVIGYQELLQEGRLIIANNYRSFEIFATVAVIYLALTLLSSRAFGFLETWMNPVNRSLKKS
ncbi:ABC transporter permease subunit [Planktothrix sp. FACHB-1355]|uniref:ABC transporter permease subunit n=1 Tax=Aerosakkonema funiforme FACHB-1375 TaxID=2949571 RepID=A0A926VKQ9_9CYAN|nr:MULTISPECIES: ABC transporter permease subunit [Oscillatoriales]MBD2184214.1 ABC transporter permease subunit [Aerosakkonema funiforme FACHB-1375]MBD3562442.1 ABC transporter permease subunit [Planktothrix sp. FACHB-1355]